MSYTDRSDDPVSESSVPVLGQPFPPEGRFRVLRSLGEGGMGVVYEVLDEQRGGKVALKTMLRVSPDGIARFKREFRALADLHHPNLVNLYELGCEGAQWFFTMELIEGGEFLEYVRPETLDEGRLRAVLPQLVSGLMALHAAGMVHRDVKPSNVRVTPAGRVVLLDFGLVAELAAPLGGSAAASFVGTPTYMAPEQADGASVGPAADWYALGALLYEALTGKVPFEGPPLQVLIRKQRERPAPPEQIAPGVPADLASLCMDLMAPLPAERPIGAHVIARLARRSLRPPQSSPGPVSSPFVGRVPELTQLREAFEQAAAGKAVLTLVQGESGVGKSSLVKHFTDELARERADLLVVAGRCYERESVPYKAFDGVVDSLAHRLARLPDAGASALIPDNLGALCQVFPVLRRVRVFAAMTRPVTIAPQELRRRAFGALRQLLARLTAKSALVIVVDDLQWTDADSMSLLREVLRQPEAPPLLFIATVRVAARSGSGSLGALSPSRLEAELPGSIRHIEVGRLGPREARELAERLLRDIAPERAASATSIAEETGGHPMFIDALARHTASEPASEGTPSLKLDDALWSRVTQLDAAGRNLVELVAVAGAPMAQEAMASAAGLDMAELGRVLGGLRAANLVRTAGARGADAVEAYHDRVREAVTARIDAGSRARLHGQLAIALEAAAAPDVEALARHWTGAGDTARALRNARLAAEQASTALAFDRSAQWWQRTLELSPEGSPEKKALRLQLADALANAGRGARAAEEYEAAARGGSGGEALDLRRRAAEQLLRSGHFDRGLAMAREALAAVNLTLPATPLGALVRLLFWRFVLLLRGTRFRERDPSEIAPRVLTRIDVAWSLAIGLAMTDNVYGALFNTRTLLLALRAGEPFRVSRSLSAEATFRAVAGKPVWAGVKRIIQSARTLAERTGNMQARAFARGTEGVSHYLNGRFRTALTLCDEATQLYRQSGGTPSEMVSAQLLGINALSYLGDLQDLRKRVFECIEDAVDRGDLYAEVSFTIGYPNLAWLVDDDPATARAKTAVAMKKWSKQGFHLEHYYELLAETHVDLYTGDFEAARERLRQRAGALRRSLVLRFQSIRITIAFLQARAALGIASVHGSRRQEMLAEAAACARRIAREDTEWGEPIATWLEAGIAAARGEVGAAQLRTKDAIAGFEAADMRLLSLVAELGSAMLAKDADRTASAEQKLRERGIANPGGFVRMFAPSFIPPARAPA